MEDLVKYYLLYLLILPFAALITDTLGQTDGILLKVLIKSTFISVFIALLMNGFHQRLNVAAIYSWSFVAWPFLILVAKGINFSIPWSRIWISISIMSWYLTNTSMSFYYPTNGGGGGFGLALGFILGWAYLLIPFAILSIIFLCFQKVLQIKKQKMPRLTNS